MTYILLDDTNNYFPNIEGTEVIVSPKRQNKAHSWIKGAWNALVKSRNDDTIVCWLDIQAVIIYWLSLLTWRRKRNIIAINILLKKKAGLKNRIAAIIYRKALKSDRFNATVTSLEYGDYLNQTLGLKVKFTLLPDIFPDEYNNWAGTPGDGSVFCGGNNSRDWQFILNLAQSMPDITFRFVMPKDKYMVYHKLLPENVTAKHSLSFEEFINELSKCSIVALPVDTEAPAGLIVIYQATALGKAVITTSTHTTRGYINGATGIALPNDLMLWKEAITTCLSNSKQMTQLNLGLRHFLSENCSSKLYASKVKSLVDSVSGTKL
ncbi:MAG: glycosyltransferase [Muribaculum sp.]|nr:glycosyltransferase [Muribaculum sp.]